MMHMNFDHIGVRLFLLAGCVDRQLLRLHGCVGIDAQCLGLSLDRGAA